MAVDPEALGREIEERGYELRIGETISRGWTLIQENFWLCVGATLLTILVSQAASMRTPRGAYRGPNLRVRVSRRCGPGTSRALD